MKMNVLSLFIPIVSIIIWILLLYLQLFKDINVFNNIKVSAICQSFAFILDITNVILVYKIYLNTRTNNNKINQYFMISVICLFLLDIVYFIVFSIPHLLSYVFLFDLLHYAYYFVTIIFFITLLSKYILKTKQFFIILFAAIVIDFIIFKTFSINVQYIFEGFSYRKNIRLTNSFVDLLVFDLAILWLVYSKNIGASLIASGYVILTAGEFMMTSSYLSKTKFLLDYCELIWMLGLILIMCGMVKIINTKSYNIKEWFRTNAAINSKLTFWSFSVAFISLIAIFVIVQQFSIINKMFFMFFPTILMIYSLIVAYLSIFIGNAFEKPFKQLANNIETVVLNNDKSKMNANFSIDEFVFLQKHFEHAFAIKEERDYLRNKFAEMATRILHDIKSPISVIESLVDDSNKYTAKEKNDLLTKQVSIIKTISNSILAERRNNMHITTDKRYQTLYAIIHDAVKTKTTEWQLESPIIDIEYNINQIVWIPPSQEGIRIVISNLLNNAFEASGKTDRINIKITLFQQNICIFIKDNGCGIPEAEINQVLAGKSLKDNGNGIGLSSAMSFIKSIGGNLEINSKLDSGTTIKISFPIVDVPKIFGTQMSISTKNVAILENDPNIITYWQENFFISDLNVIYFILMNAFIKWIQDNKSLILDTTFLIDIDTSNNFYEDLLNINELNLPNTYLITNHAEESWLQDKVKTLSFKIIPKAELNPHFKISII